MHDLYKNIPFEDACRILDYCRRNTIQSGGLFEVYSTPGQDIHMIIVNSSPEDGPMEMFRPLGAFYLNYLHAGSVTIENEDPNHDSMPSTKRHVAAIKQVIDILIEQGFPGTHIRFNDLPAVNDLSK